MAAPGRDQAPNMEVFDSYFRRADLDQDGRISGAEAVGFFQGSNLPKHVLAQIWTYADHNRTGFLGRPEFYNALKLVTVAQSGRQLTPDIVKAALYGPAAAKIPAPQINPVSSPAAQMLSARPPQLNSVVPPSIQMGVVAPTSSQNLGFRGPQANPSVGMNQQFFPSSDSHFMRPPQTTPASASFPTQGVNQGLSGAGSVAGPRLPGSNAPNLSTDWLSARTSGASMGGIPQGSVRGVTPSTNQDGFGLAISGTAPGVSPIPQMPSASPSSIPLKPVDPVLSSSQPAANNSKALDITGNGFSSDPVFGGDVFTAASRSKPDASTAAFSASTMPNSSGIASVAAGSQNSIKTGQLDSLQSASILPQGSGHLQRTQPLVKQNQLDTIQSTSASTASNVSIGNSASSQSQLHWPRITQSDIQKYTAVFVEVDKDRDGKITGEQARNLFLSWRLPREVLKQVWDLSDQDNDSMLSLREFCNALYLMERYREGRPLPAVLPNTLKFDETLLHATPQPSTAYSGLARQPNPGLSQQGIPGSRPPVPFTGIRPPSQSSFTFQTDGSLQTVQQKSRVPVLEKSLVNQLSKAEQSALNSKFQEAIDADKNVQELENEILDSREKIEFYRTKMQELVLYKSRCDNRLNEITERASADKREAESLSKKYEEKYKQVGEIASKLTVEEATYRDIQERKLELHNAIVKMEQGGSADGLLQVRADRIQSDLEELTKALNERCKRYGVHAKSTAIIELPFGWQPGIQEGAADWVEDWDKFEDDGFTIAKELSIDVDNGVATANPKSPSAWSDKASTDEFSPVSSSNFTGKHENRLSIGERITEIGAYDQSEVGSARSPPGSPGRSTLESPSQEFHSSQFGMHDISPRSKGSHSEHGGAESTISGDKYADDPSWVSTFDANDDVDSVWGFNATNTKETDYEMGRRDSVFGSGDFGLNSIKVDSPSAGRAFGKEKRSQLFADSVPSSPLFNSGSSPKFNEGPEDHSLDSFSRFDSFSTQSGGLFPQRETLSRFDSTLSTADFDRGRGESLARFDSMRSTADFDRSRGFPSFDDADPFGSTGPFKPSGSQSPRRGSDNWRAF